MEDQMAFFIGNLFNVYPVNRKLVQLIFIHTEEMPGREKIETAGRAMSKIENLNAIVPRTAKLKLKGRITPDIRLHSAMKADYSTIYKENVILEENLEDHLSYIKKNERRALEEKGEELDEMRRQMDVISKLQEAVNSRNPADSLDVLSANKAVRFGQQWLNENKKSRAQLKIEAEREKFSSRNMFNVRRFHTGFDFLHSKKRIPPPAMQLASDNEDEGNTDDFLKNESLKPQRAQQTKGYLRQTFSSTSGLRPMTATVTYQREQKEDDILPPRAKSAILRSRSRRQLELLCRVTPKEDELEITADFQIDWKVVNERRRRQKLQQLQAENEELKGKVSHFLSVVDEFNKRPISGKRNNVKVSKGDAILAKLLKMQEVLSFSKSAAAELESGRREICDVVTERSQMDNSADSREVSFRETNSSRSGNLLDGTGRS